MSIFRERTHRKSSVLEYNIINFFNPKDLYDASENDWNKNIFKTVPDFLLSVKLAINQLVSKGLLEEFIPEDNPHSSTPSYLLTNISEDLFVNKPSMFNIERQSSIIE